MIISNYFFLFFYFLNFFWFFNFLNFFLFFEELSIENKKLVKVNLVQYPFY